MLKASIRLSWRLGRKEGQALARLIELLTAIDEERSISAAATKLGMSYRHAWGMIREAGSELGAPVLNMSRGRRATLSALGRKLVEADQRIKARIAPLLDSLASELEAEVERSRSGPGSVLRIHASHGYALELLREFLVRRSVPVDLKYRGSMEALASLAGGSCDVGGFHAPLGPLQGKVLAFYSRWLDPARQVLIHLSTRRQGIMVARGNPKHIQSLGDLSQPGVRFVNRQFGSGTRILLDLLLNEEGLDSAMIDGYDTGEFTHSGVAACISSGLADAGFGLEHGARQFDLEFVPVISERYFLICDRTFVDAPAMRRIRDILSSKQYRAEAGSLVGIDVTQAGTLLGVEEAFPELAPSISPVAR